MVTKYHFYQIQINNLKQNCSEMQQICLIFQGQHQVAASAILLKAKVQIRVGLTMMKTNRHFSIIAIKSGLQRLWHRRPHRRALQRPYTVVIFTFLTLSKVLYPLTPSKKPFFIVVTFFYENSHDFASSCQTLVIFALFFRLQSFSDIS